MLFDKFPDYKDNRTKITVFVRLSNIISIVNFY